MRDDGHGREDYMYMPHLSHRIRCVSKEKQLAGGCSILYYGFLFLTRVSLAQAQMTGERERVLKAPDRSDKMVLSRLILGILMTFHFSSLSLSFFLRKTIETIRFKRPGAAGGLGAGLTGLAVQSSLFQLEKKNRPP